jgi:hypothetical protein
MGHHLLGINLDRRLRFQSELAQPGRLMCDISRLDKSLAGHTTEPRAVAADLSLFYEGGLLS